MSINRFEELDAWKKARELTRAVYRLTAQDVFLRDRALRDQMRRAAVSTLSNIAEGFERDGNREFRQFLSHAKGSVGEIRAQLYVALDAETLTTQQFDQLYDLATQTSRLIAGLMRYLDQSEMKGLKYRATREGLADYEPLDLPPIEA